MSDCPPGTLLSWPAWTCWYRLNNGWYAAGSSDQRRDCEAMVRSGRIPHGAPVRILPRGQHPEDDGSSASN